MHIESPRQVSLYSGHDIGYATSVRHKIVTFMGDIQGGTKVGIQYIVYKLLYTYFWPTLYETELKPPNYDKETSIILIRLLMIRFVGSSVPDRRILLPNVSYHWGLSARIVATLRFKT